MTTVYAIEFSQGIEDAFADVVAFVPKLIGFLIILIVGYFVAKAIAKILAAILEKVGFDAAVEKGGVKQALDKSKYDASDLLGKIVFYAVFLFVLQMAFGVFGTNPISDLLTSVIAYLPKVFVAILIMVVASAIAAAAREVIDAGLGGLSYGKALGNGVAIAITVVGAFAALNQLQIAPEIVTGMFYALLAIVAGVTIIAVGGGGILPMRQRWENALNRLDEEMPKVREQRDGAKERIQERAQQRKDQAQGAAQPEGGSSQSNTRPIQAR